MIPERLRKCAQWVNWKTVQRGDRATKIPIQPDGRPASSTDPATWNHFEKLNPDLAPGFVFSGDDPYIGIDLDGCRDPLGGKLDEWAKSIVLRFGTYAEVSPSGTGVKLFGVSDEIWQGKNKTSRPGDGHGGKKPGIEVYDCGRYFAVTGKTLRGHAEIVAVDQHLEWLMDTYGLRQSQNVVDGSDIPPWTDLGERAAKYLSKLPPAINGQRGSDACFHAACVLVLGFALAQDEAMTILAGEYNARCVPPWSEKELRHKVESAFKQPGPRGYLAEAKPQDWSKIYVRTTPTETAEELEEVPATNRTTLEAATFEYVKRLEDGKQYLIETGIPDLDYAIGGGMAPGEMIIVAARPSHGKSAIALQMVHHLTASGIKAIIISEEMSALSIGKRTIQFVTDIPEEHWQTRDEDLMASLSLHFSGRKEAIILESCGTTAKVVEEVERAVKENGVGVAVIDYVQLLMCAGKSSYERVTESSKEMRRMANRLGIVVIVLAQLNREIESRKQFIPMMSDLKETGQLEQDADVIVFGVWPHRLNPSAPSGEYQFYVAKNRNRAINAAAFKAEFDPKRQRMIEASARYEANFDHELAEWNNR